MPRISFRFNFGHSAKSNTLFIKKANIRIIKKAYKQKIHFIDFEKLKL